MSNKNNTSPDQQIITTRLVNAPRELVYKVWTDPEHIVKWWGPDGFTNTIQSMEVKPGGQWRFIMHGPDGTDYPNLITYKEVIPPARLVYAHGSGEENDAHSFDVTVTFEEQDGQTMLTMTSTFKTKEARDFVVKNYGAIEGARQTLNKLEAYLQQL